MNSPTQLRQAGNANRKPIRVSIIACGHGNEIPGQILSDSGLIRIVRRCEASPKLVEAVARSRSDLVFLESDIVYGSTWRYLALLKRVNPGIGVLVLSAAPELSLCIRYLHAGADGVYETPGNRESLEKAVAALQRGEKWLPPDIQASIISRILMSPSSRQLLNDGVSNLSRAEHELMVYLGMGYFDKEIARVKNVSERTINTQTHSIFKKLNVHNRREAVSQYFALPGNVGSVASAGKLNPKILYDVG